MFYQYRCALFIITLLGYSNAYGDSGLSSGVGFAEAIIFSFLIWIGASLYSGIYLVKTFKMKRLILVAPFVPLLVMFSLLAVGMVIGISLPTSSSSSAETAGVYSSIFIHMLACFYCYAKTKKEWIKSLIVRLVAPLLALGSILIGLSFT